MSDKIILLENGTTTTIIDNIYNQLNYDTMSDNEKGIEEKIDDIIDVLGIILNEVASQEIVDQVFNYGRRGKLL